MKKIFFIVVIALFLNSCGGPDIPEGFVMPDTPPNPDLMQPNDNPVE